MAERGDVLRSKRRVGFTGFGPDELFVVVQDNPLNAVLGTGVVLPLIVSTAANASDPLLVAVPRGEVGRRRPTWWLRMRSRTCAGTCSRPPRWRS